MSKYFWMIQIVSLRINIRHTRANLSLSFQEWPAHLPNMPPASIKLPSKYTSLRTWISIPHHRNSFCSGCQVIQRLTSVQSAENEYGVLSPGWDNSITPHPRLRDHHRVGMERLRGKGWGSAMGCCPLVRMNSLQLWLMAPNWSSEYRSSTGWGGHTRIQLKLRSYW